MAKIVETANDMYLHGSRVQWGGGHLGVKSTIAMKKLEKRRARELAGRA